MFAAAAAALGAALLLVVLCPTDAKAYLDPGTGSYVLQMIIAGLLGAAVGIRVFWQRIKSFFIGVFSRSGKND